MTFTSNGSAKLIENLQFIRFSSEPDFLGQRDYFNPIGFFLHPQYSEGKEYLITLDHKAVLENERTGEVMS